MNRCWQRCSLTLRRVKPVYKRVDTCAAEFESATPYFYSTYEWENESIKSDKESVIVLGSGPIRIGQGVEFDYATVHSVKAIQAAGRFNCIVGPSLFDFTSYCQSRSRQ